MCVPVCPGDFGKFASRWIERWTGHFSHYLAAFSARACVRVNQSNTMDFDEQRAIVASSTKAAGTRGDLRRLLAVPRFGARLPQVVWATFPARLPTKQHKAQHPGKDRQYDPRQIYPNLDACRVATCWVR